MRVALDTNRYVDLCKGVAETLALLEEAEAILLPFVVVGELRAGFAHGRRQVENERILRRFLLKDGVRVIFADEQTTHHYASVFRQLRKQARRFRPMICGWRLSYCSTTLPCTHAISTSITSRKLSAFEYPGTQFRPVSTTTCSASDVQ